MQNLQENFSEQLIKNQKIVFPKQSSTRRFPKFLGKLFNYWCLFVAGFLVVIFAPPLMLIGRLSGNNGLVQRGAMWGAATWLKLCGVKTLLRGAENLKSDETYVFISNHRSYLETAIVEAHLGRHVGIISKKELLKLPVAGRLMGYIDMLAIDRSNPKRAVETMQDAVRRIHNGLSVVVFAEGTRAMPGELLPFKKGAFHLAIEAGVPIIPIAVKNSDVLMGKKTGVAQPGTIETVLLPQIPTIGLDAEKDLESLRDRV
ncbi:MAG: lysophospholipid acyltransferase family protein, partial [Pyrinomonadaceae bacterium]